SHVCGTLIASGVQSSAKGMSPAATVDSYEFNNDLAEMTSRAMTIPGEAGTLQISNHSYGFATGWEYGTNPPRWYGTWGKQTLSASTTAMPGSGISCVTMRPITCPSNPRVTTAMIQHPAKAHSFNTGSPASPLEAG
ncbi:MAG: hypothetical protein ACYSPI_10690, partial [Planctomycetota bacterium]